MADIGFNIWSAVCVHQINRVNSRKLAIDRADSTIHTCVTFLLRLLAYYYYYSWFLFNQPTTFFYHTVHSDPVGVYQLRTVRRIWNGGPNGRRKKPNDV